MTIPRTNIQDISYHRITPGPVSRTATHPPAAPGATNQGALTSLKTPAGQEAVQTVLADKIGNRSPEATQKYLGLVEGLQSGRTNLSDIRLQAGTLLRQLDELSRELDQEPGAELWREYKAILEDFVRRYDKGER
jgi:hypothetical protein